MTTAPHEPQSISNVHVALGERSYDIMIGEGLFANIAAYIAPALVTPRTVIISDETVWQHYGSAVQAALVAQGIQTAKIVVATGEGSKSYEGLQTVMEGLLAAKIDRATTIIALGGGVVGDLAGFAASIALRGVPFIQIPTSLLAQVDSSVGGKTAINSAHGKNLIGSFYQPRLVIADIGVLKTLPARQMLSGYAEIIKYGLIADTAFYHWCLRHGARMMAGETAYLARAVEASCQMKADIVGEDERESAKRALLNLGHTFGHALEAETGFSDALLHGEAVAIGMVMACALSEKLGYIDGSIRAELAAHFKALGLPASPKDIRADWNVDALMEHMAVDKKAEDGALNFIVLKQLGQAAMQKRVDAALVRAVLAGFIG